MNKTLRTTIFKKKQVLQLLRIGMSNLEASRELDMHVQSIIRWMKTDKEFLKDYREAKKHFKHSISLIGKSDNATKKVFLKMLLAKFPYYVLTNREKLWDRIYRRVIITTNKHPMGNAGIQILQDSWRMYQQ